MAKAFRDLLDAPYESAANATFADYVASRSILRRMESNYRAAVHHEDPSAALAREHEARSFEFDGRKYSLSEEQLRASYEVAGVPLAFTSSLVPIPESAEMTS